VQIYHNFISEEEARHIVSLAGPQVRRGGVAPAAQPSSGQLQPRRDRAGTFGIQHS
jgi:hypothetical protein